MKWTLPRERPAQQSTGSRPGLFLSRSHLLKQKKHFQLFIVNIKIFPERPYLTLELSSSLWQSSVLFTLLLLLLPF